MGPRLRGDDGQLVARMSEAICGAPDFADAHPGYELSTVMVKLPYSDTGVPMKSRLPSSSPQWRRMS